MRYDDLVVLIPSHSLEDFPSELGEQDAAGLLNAFAVLWHPLLLAEAQAMPHWHRADEPPEELADRLIIVPTASDDWIPGGWVGHAQREGAVVISGLSERGEMIEAATAPLRPPDEADDSDDASASPASEETRDSELQDADDRRPPSSDSSADAVASSDEQTTRDDGDPQTIDNGPPHGDSPPQADATPLRVNWNFDVDHDLVADFLALGTCYLQVELLTRHMHHFSNLDEVHLQREAVAAAEAAVADDAEACRTHLRACFEALLEARERFYPVDCYLIDLCLLIPRLADEHLERMVTAGKPVSLLLSGQDLEEIAADKPEIVHMLRRAWEAGTIDVAGGELREAPTPLLSIESVLWEIARGREVYQKHFGRTPTTWGRRRFGFSTQIPQLISRFGFHSALHFALDDGIYPDAEQSKIRWEGCDGTVVDAITRIPLAGDSAVSFLRFAVRMAESMEEDQVAAVIFARWPELTTPWFEDFRRMQNYAPCLGRLVTLSEFFEHTDDPGRLSSYTAGEYFSPFLVQTVAKEEADPISRFVDYYSRSSRFRAAAWCRAAAPMLLGATLADKEATGREDGLERAAPDSTPLAVSQAEELLNEFEPAAAKRLAEVITASGEPARGYLVINTLSFPRRVSVELPEMETPPQADEAIKAVQFDEQHKLVTVGLPASGFTWISASGVAGTSSASRKSDAPTAEGNVLRNELFEVYVNEATGGIRTIKGYGRSPNRLSQQLAFRFPRERLIKPDDPDEPEEKTYYSEMRCHSLSITSDGPALGEIVTAGEIVDQQDGSRLAGFRQTFRVWRGRPVVEIDVELEIDRMPDGDPWTNYYATRFAWNDSTAALTRSVQMGAHGFQGERFESPHYLEIADEEQRTTILGCGLPFHRRTGMRMVDSLLVVKGETRRRFRFVVAVEANYPMQAALDAMTPPIVVPTERRPRSGPRGWFFHLSAKNVQLLSILELGGEAPQESSTIDERPVQEQHDHPPSTGGPGFVLRLIETEGRSRQVKLGCFKTPSTARLRDFRGRPLNDLPIEADTVLIDMSGHEIADVELRFDAK